MWQPPPRYLLLTLLALVLIATLYRQSVDQNESIWPAPSDPPSPKAKPTPTPTLTLFKPGIPKPVGHEYRQTLVVASMRHEDTTWIARELPNLNTAIYLADDPSAPFHPPVNKGHEAMIYLTYIIDHYDNLSDTSIFVHAGQETWHNNDLQDWDLAKMLSQLSNNHIARVGYFNLRCHPESGCADHINVDAQEQDGNKLEEIYFARVWSDLHGSDVPMPKVLSAPCCAQFAASRERIQSVPLSTWQHYRDWLLNTDLEDHISGRIFEQTWHVIMTGEPRHCPRIDLCYCDGYGICFTSEAALDAWLTLREVKFLADETVKDRVALGRDHGDLDDHLLRLIVKPLETRLAEAVIRGNDPQTRAALAGRPWEEGDGF